MGAIQCSMGLGLVWRNYCGAGRKRASDGQAMQKSPPPLATVTPSGLHTEGGSVFTLSPQCILFKP